MQQAIVRWPPAARNDEPHRLLASNLVEPPFNASTFTPVKVILEAAGDAAGFAHGLAAAAFGPFDRTAKAAAARQRGRDLVLAPVAQLQEVASRHQLSRGQAPEAGYRMEGSA